MNRIVKSFSTFTIVSVFGSAAGFILMPILTHHLTIDDYGTLALFNAYVQLVIPFVGLSSFGLVSIEYFNRENSKSQFKSIFSSILIIPLPVFILLFILSWVWRKQFSLLLDIPSSAVIFIACFAFLSVLFQQFQNFVVTKKETGLYAAINIGKTILEYSLVVFFVVLLQRGWFGRVEAALLVFLLICPISFWFYVRWGLLTSRINLQYIKAGIIYGYPLIAHVIGRFVINQSDKIFISKMVSNGELGVYNTGYLLGSIIMILSGAFINVYTPFLYERLSDITERKKLEIVRLSYLYILVLTIATIAVSVISPSIFRLLINEAYSNGVLYVFWVSLGYLFWGGYLLFAGYLFYFKKTKTLATFATLNVALNLILNYYLISIYGPLGAAYATVISFFTVFAMVMFVSQKIYPMPWFAFKRIFYGFDK